MPRLDRRAFAAGALALGLPIPSLAGAGNASSFFGSFRDGSGADHLAVLDEAGQPSLLDPLPDRGHAGAFLREHRAFVLVARRPGRFALVYDIDRKHVSHHITPPVGHHFYGHAARLQNGLLALPENAFEDGIGVVGLYDPQQSYVRVGQFGSGNIGPHEVIGLQGGRALAIANGGLQTHPDLGRATLNLDTMRSSIDVLDNHGETLARWLVPDDLRLLSLRHLAVGAHDTLILAGQWQGQAFEDPPLVASCRRGEALRFHRAPDGIQAAMALYCGSVAVDPSGRWAAITSPRGDIATVWRVDLDGLSYSHSLHFTDICGVAANQGAGQFRLTTGQGLSLDHQAVPPQSTVHPQRGFGAWDNHLTSLT